MVQRGVGRREAIYSGLRSVLRGLCHLAPFPEHWEMPAKRESSQGAYICLSALSWAAQSQLQSWRKMSLTDPPATSQPGASCQSQPARGGDGCSEHRGECRIRAADTLTSRLGQPLKLLGLQKGDRHLEQRWQKAFPSNCSACGTGFWRIKKQTNKTTAYPLWAYRVFYHIFIKYSLSLSALFAWGCVQFMGGKFP